MAVRAFRAHEINRIILTRPAVEAGEKLGFLPGDLQNLSLIHIFSHAEKTAYVILRVADNDAAEKVLRDHGSPILSGEDVY